MTDFQQELPLDTDTTDAGKRRTRRAGKSALLDAAPPPSTTVVLWMLRLLVRGRVLRSLAVLRAWPDDDVLTGLGLPQEVVSAFHDPRRCLTVTQTEELFTRWLEALEKGPVSRDQAVFRNAAWLAERVGLGEVEQELLAFASLVQSEPGFSDCFRSGRPGAIRTRAHELLARMLDVRVDQIAGALASDGALTSLRLLDPAGTRHHHHGYAIAVSLSDALEETLRTDHQSPEALVRHFFTEAPAATLGLGDYAHVGKPLELLRGLVARAIEARATGVNVLLHGPPGTGKTELARTIAAAVGASLHEVSVADSDDDPAGGRQRLMSYCISQRLLSRAPRALVVFDELEDAFPRSFLAAMGLKQESHPTKGWINRTLESNPVPTLWLGNHVDQLDPAFVRRFHLVVELPEPPPHVRARMLRQHAGRFGVSDAWVERHAPDRRLRPGHIHGAARVVGLLAPETPAAAEELLGDVLAGALALEGQPPPRPAGNDACDYDPTLVNTDADLDRVCAGLAGLRRGTLCFYGPPGTGKTAFASHLATRLGVPLLAKRASDLLGKYVGETEKRIAAMFREARDSGALLFLDEADGFLQNRTRADHSWELTQVNELLVGAERFEGIFICATNLMDALDPAIYRRFSLKIRFSPLTSEQRLRILGATLARLGAAVDAAALAGARGSLDRLPELTAGDFAAVARRLRLLGGVPTVADALQGLEEEHRFKPAGAVRRAGFAAGG